MMPGKPTDEPLAKLFPFPGMHQDTPNGGELATTDSQQQPQDRRPGDVERAGEVLDAEIVDEEEYRRSRARRGAATVVRAVRVGATHDRTRGTWRFVLRHGTYVAKGAEQARQRKRAERSQATARAARDEALKTGDHGTVALLNQQIHAARQHRVQTLKEYSELAWVVTKRCALAGSAATGGALVVGAINGAGHWLGDWSVMDVLHILGGTITTTADVVGFSVTHWWLLGGACLAVWGFRRWKDGIKLGEHVLPERLRRDTSSGPQLVLTENLLVKALANIGNKYLNGAVKEGWPNRDTDNAWVRPPMPTARGWGAQLRLPMGASVEAISKAKTLLAHNLGCLAAELFLEASEDDPTVLDLFRLDRGVLREPVPAYPLLDEGTTNYWDGFPVGVSPRGGEVSGYVFERNYVVAGIMGSGKTTLIIALLVGAVLDPLVDVDVFVFADNEDYTQLEPALHLFRKGDTADNVAGLLDYFEELQADLETRGQLLRKHGITSVTREAAAKEPGLRPKIVVIDECQSFFRQDTPELRRKVVNMVVRFQSKARKYAITLVFATPSPSDQNLPRDLVAVTSNRGCFAIGDKTRNNVVLGDKAHENGISALGLKPKTKDKLNDVGTFVGIGFLDAGPGAVRTYHITPAEQAQVVARAVEARGGPVDRKPMTVVKRNLLADLGEVLGVDAMPAAKCPPLLTQLVPDWAPYRSLTRDALVSQLADLGVKVPSTGNRWPVDPEAVREALAARTEASVDVDGGDSE